MAALVGGSFLLLGGLMWAADPAVLRPPVPRDQIETARAVTNPLPASEEMIANGLQLSDFGRVLQGCCAGCVQQTKRITAGCLLRSHWWDDHVFDHRSAQP